ncbi:unnamed protein product [Peniophora sp. CBMAI 1063]|nr:unnamed protein product [Peniophora sp. CBMAI 1063]
MQAGNASALPPTDCSPTPDALERVLLSDSDDIGTSQPSPAADVPPLYDVPVKVIDSQYQGTLLALSANYLEIASRLSTLGCVTDADAQLLRKYSDDFKLLARLDSEQPSGQLSVEFPSLASYHVLAFAVLLCYSPGVVYDVWSDGEASIACVLIWLKNVAQVIYWNVIPTTPLSPVENMDFFMSCAGTFEIFAPFMKWRDGCYEFGGLEADDSGESWRFPQSRRSDDGQSSHGISGSSSDERSPSPSIDHAASRCERLTLSSSVHALRFDSDTGSYSVDANFYSVNNNVVSIRLSDALPSRAPPVEQNYVILPLGDRTHLSWRQTIGMFISGALLSQTSDAPSNRKLWVLESFPPDYVLARRTRRTRKKDGTEKSRTDVYLYGGKSRFASPAEFAAHAIWLMRGAIAGDCACKHCSNASQETITATLEELLKSVSSYSRGSGGTRRRASWNGQTRETAEVNTTDAQVRRRLSV